ncbi:tetratricopeptide repeat protein [Streptomyces sp. NPDC057654]|uniref:tetratricopeptide repeat protein n=1 Tax=Streptomyces sp. NPDC057654 TaxID=3346196 RepID=UPI0036792D66
MPHQPPTSMDRSTAGRARTPNRALAAAIRETGRTYQSLATRVNALADRRGQDTGYDKSSVSRWISGTVPRPETVWLIADVLTELLGWPVQPHDIGFRPYDSDTPVAARSLLCHRDLADALGTLAELADQDGRHLGACPAAQGVLLAPQCGWLLRVEQWPTAPVLPEQPGGRVGMVHSMASAFDQMDNRFGGQGVRSSILAFLNEVVPLLRRGVAPGERARLFTGAARLGAVAGWSSYDSGEYGLAQRYMVQALRLCREGGDRVLAGQILAGLSHLATSLGYPQDGVDLAHAGLRAARDAGSPLGLMRVHAMVARAMAARGHRSEALRALRAAEAALGQSRGAEQESAWVQHLDPHYWEAEAAFVFRDLGQARQAEEAAERSARANGDRRRRQAISQSVLATACLQQNRLDEALAAASTALEYLEGVCSVRSVQALRDFCRRLDPVGDEPAVRAFLRAARPVLGQ